MSTKRQYSDNDLTCSVYGLKAKDSDLYFYIGSTKFNPQARFKQHLDVVRLGYNKNRHFVNKVKKIGAENIVCELLEMVSAETRFEREYEWIRDLLKQGVKLTNVIRSADVYRTERETEEYQDQYLAKVSSPAYLIPAMSAFVADDKPIAKRPEDQPLLDSLQRAACRILRELIVNRRQESAAYLGVEVQWLEELTQKATKQQLWSSYNLPTTI